MIKTPVSKKLIQATGKDSFELQNNFNAEMSKLMNAQDDLAKEIWDMFMPAFYWEKEIKEEEEHARD